MFSFVAYVSTGIKLRHFVKSDWRLYIAS